MASLKHVLSKVRRRSKSVSHASLTSPELDGASASPVSNDAIDADIRLLRPHRRLSVTEQRDDRKHQRIAKDEEQMAARRLMRKQLHDEDPLRDNYGDLHTHPLPHLLPLSALATASSGHSVSFRARVHHIRPLSATIVFLILRYQLATVQAVISVSPDVSQNMVRWAGALARETVVLVEGIAQSPPEDQHAVKSVTVHALEVHVKRLFTIVVPTVSLPFQVQDVMRFADHDPTPRTRLAHRVLDLRAPPAQAIFRIRAGVCALFREFLVAHGFLEIQSSKFQASSTEVGAAVFKVDYFRRPAFLAQSPQLAKQMCIAADMERVFEIGPVFRAENSNTHRHLTEFTGLDLEMTFDVHYHEVLDTIDEMLLYIFRGMQHRFCAEIETVKQLYPHDNLVFLDKTPRLTFAEGVRLLKDSGWQEEDGSVPSEWEDLSTKAEKRLGQLIKDKYHTDYFILDKFPAEARPFYTMPDPDVDGLSNSFDIFLRGEEILSGGQRIHYAPLLEERMHDVGVDPESMKDYVDGFRWGCLPHGGGGVGLERLIMLFLQLGNVRWANLFPRDPRSFAMSGQDLAQASTGAAAATVLHGPESKTFKLGVTHGELPLLENLIAKYGDATNTSWIDPAWTVWRDRTTGAAVGYIPQNGFAVTFGNPLCEPLQITRVVKAYLQFLRERRLKPVWCCIDKETERCLAEDLGWSAVVAVAEERLNPIEVDLASNDKTMRRKIHRAEREGIKIIEVMGKIEDTVMSQIEERCREWEARRKGSQIHLTGVRPFDDIVHRKYYYAVDREARICALVVLAQLAPTHGFQIKWALEFPGAPLGAIEYILSCVIKKLGNAGVRSATFGAGATGSLHRIENISGVRVRMLEKAYNGLAHTFSLRNKGDFRSKFGIRQDPLYICYPKGALGMKGIEAIMAVLQAPK